MKKHIRSFLSLLLTLIFLFSIGKFLLGQREKSLGGNAYAEALELATSKQASAPKPRENTETAEVQWVAAAPEEPDPHIRELAGIDLDALREHNPQVVAWIRIPDTEIDYPMLQAADNDYYLKHTWDQKKNDVGAIFLEHLNAPELTDFNTIVYGHNMMDGSMFAGLRKYQKQSYWEEHPYVYLRSDEGVYRYEIFSSYLADVESTTYGLQFPSGENKTRFLEGITGNSVITTGITPRETDRILTLSTCSGKGHTTRWVVHARLALIPA